MKYVITNNNIQCTVALAALQNVTDPEIGLNIVDLGLIYQIDFDERCQKIYCTMTLTTQFCPMGESITNAAEEVLNDSFPEYQTIITLTFDPPWNHERISVEGHQFLNN
jgi:metal-sulfur cluster biosynthetic enzyme